MKSKLNLGNACYHAVQNLLFSYVLPKNIMFKTCCIVVFPVVFMDVKPDFMLRKEHRLGVFENRVLRRIFALKKDEVNGGWRKLHNEELRNMNFLPYIVQMFKSKKMRWAMHVAYMGR
jgi:hypothetical protein